MVQGQDELGAAGGQGVRKGQKAIRLAEKVEGGTFQAAGVEGQADAGSGIDGVRQRGRCGPEHQRWVRRAHGMLRHRELGPLRLRRSA